MSACTIPFGAPVAVRGQKSGVRSQEEERNDEIRMANDEFRSQMTIDQVPMTNGRGHVAGNLVPVTNGAAPPTEQERFIYRRVKFEGEKQTAVAGMLNINQSTVSRAICRYERWIAAGGQEQEAGLPHAERLRAQRWLTFERNEWILSAALRIAAEMERQLDTSRSLVTSSGMTPGTTKQIRTEHKVIDRSGIAARFLRLAWRINMDQLRLMTNDQVPMANDRGLVTNDQVPMTDQPGDQMQAGA